jgi:hypothetical protein
LAPDGGAVHCCLVTAEPGATGYYCTCSEAECGADATEVTACTPEGLATSTWCDLLAPYPPDGGTLHLPGAAAVATCR